MEISGKGRVGQRQVTVVELALQHRARAPPVMKEIVEDSAILAS